MTLSGPLYEVVYENSHGRRGSLSVEIEVDSIRKAKMDFGRNLFIR